MNRLALILIALLFAGCVTIPQMSKDPNPQSAVYVAETTIIGTQSIFKDTKLVHWRVNEVDAYCDEGYGYLHGYGCFSGSGEELSKGMNPRTFEWEPLNKGVKITKERPQKKETVSPKIAEDVKAGVGDIFLAFESIDPFYAAENFKYDMTITSLNDKEVTLQYAEYFMSKDGGSWLIKQGFNKTFTYYPKETIRFKGYEFEPISVSNGQITYKRVK